MKLSFVERSSERRLADDYDGPVLLWDIDKTYLDTHFSSWRGLASIPLELAVDKQPIAGAVPLLRALRRGPAQTASITPLFFVSGSPPQLRRVVEHRMTLDGVQYDGISFKDQWGLMRARRPRDIKRQLGYKLKALLAYRTEVSAAGRWWMFGDDVESDAETFSLFGQVCADLRDEALEALLRKHKVHARDRHEIHTLLQDIPRGPNPVEGIVIRCTHEVPTSALPGQFYCKSFLQTALLCLDRGLLSPDDAWSVVRDIRRRGASEETVQEHLRDAVSRFSLGEAASSWMKDKLR